MMTAAKRTFLLPLAGSLAMTAAPTTTDAGIAASGSAYALDADVHAVSGLLGISVGPLPAVNGASPTPFSLAQTTLSAHASATGVASLTTGVLHAAAQSDINTLSLIGTTTAFSQVDDLSLRIVPGFLAPDLIRFSADTISSNARLSFDGTRVTASASSLIENAGLSVAGIGSLSVFAAAEPNTVLLDTLGLRIVLNEQILTTVGDLTSLEVNALRITIRGPLQAVDSDIVIAHSAATLTVPAPGGAGFTAALLGLAFARRRRP